MIDRNNPDPENRFGLLGDGSAHITKALPGPKNKHKIRKTLYIMGTLAAVAGLALMMSKPTPSAHYTTQVSDTLLVSVDKLQTEKGGLKTSYQNFLRGKSRTDRAQWERDTVQYINNKLLEEGFSTVPKISSELLPFAFYLPHVQAATQIKEGNLKGSPMSPAEFASVLSDNGFEYKPMRNETPELTEKRRQEFVENAYRQYTAVFTIEQARELQSAGYDSAPGHPNPTYSAPETESGPSM